MKIEVLHTYQSVALGARVIAPGVYDIGDPALWGQGRYLVDNGHARVMDTKSSDPVETKPVEVETVEPTIEEMPEEGVDTLVLPPEPRKPKAKR